MSKRTKYLFVVFAILMAMNLFVTGCVVERGEDGKDRIRLNPFAADKIEQTGEAGVGIAKILAPFLGPAGGIVATSLAGGLAWFKKVKPKLTQLQTKAEMSHTVATCSVDAIETLKKAHPKIWEECIKKKIHKELQAANIDTKILENFIRGLRGLPVKS